MTRARALKQVIRARVARTGERYTTARRNVLRQVNESPAVSRKDSADQKTSLASTKGGMSDATSIRKTGYGLAHWFAVLDTFGAVGRGHAQAADHLHSVHGVPGWYSQGITVAYERARGVRVMNQKCDGAFEVSISKVMAATPAQVIKAIKKTGTWGDGIDRDLLAALAAALNDKKSKGFIVRPDGQARFRYKWSDTTVQFNIYPKTAVKTSVVVSHLKLADAGAVEASRAKWKKAIASLASACL